jgi:hypothetical protein
MPRARLINQTMNMIWNIRTPSDEPQNALRTRVRIHRGEYDVFPEAPRTEGRETW